MGNGLVCFNPIHNWQLGWAKPMAQLSGATMSPGTWYSATLLEQTANLNNASVRVATDWVGAALSTANTYYVGYRQVPLSRAK